MNIKKINIVKKRILLKKKNKIIKKIKYKKNKSYNKNYFSFFKIKRSSRISQRLRLLSKQFVKKGKNKGYYFILHLIKHLKKKWKKMSNKPFENIPNIILKAKFSMVLKNKRRGSIIYELPRCLSKNQSIKKAYYWFVKLTKKRKKKTLKNLIIELNNIKNRKGALIKKRNLMKFTAKKNRPFFYLLKRRKKYKK